MNQKFIYLKILVLRLSIYRIIIDGRNCYSYLTSQMVSQVSHLSRKFPVDSGAMAEEPLGNPRELGRTVSDDSVVLIQGIMLCIKKADI